MSARVVLAVALLLAAPFAHAGDTEAVVWKSPSCGCCQGWIDYLKRNGYTAKVIDVEDIDAIKAGMGVPEAMRSCHTARIGGYIVEGHVPVEAIDKLLAEKPKVAGIASPGMPSGSPGMSGPKAPNPIFTFGRGDPTLFGAY
ncbi:MAG: DUF411 domain-containing protein [Magnetospirillum sp.]|nr:DUF411 domain-containing protein [Magnetospirillum sp.]